MPSQPEKMYTEATSPAARSPFPLIPFKLNQPWLIGTAPGWRPSTQARPATAKPTRIVYSAMAMATCVRAVSLMPATAMMSMITKMAVLIAMFAPVLVALAPATASTEGASTTTPVTAPVM